MSIALTNGCLADRSLRNNHLGVSVLSTGIHVPERKVKTAHLLTECGASEKYGISAEFLKRGLGIGTVYHAEKGLLPSDMAIPAAKMALEECKEIDLDEIDMVIFCGMDRDRSEPATAHRLNDKLGLSAAETMDISDACLGFMRGVITASRAIALGEVRYAMVASGEISSRVVDQQVQILKSGVSRNEAKSRLGFLTASDAGSAVILGPARIEENAGFGTFRCATSSQDRDKCFYKLNENGTVDAQMKMEALFKSGSALMLDSLKKYPAPNDVDFIISHQISSSYHRLIEKLNIVPRDRVIKSFDQYGNVTTNSFTMNLRKVLNDPRSQLGNNIFCLFGGSGTAYCQFNYRI